MQAPLVDELLKNDIVMQAMEDAWRDSRPQEPNQRHEEGGWVYANVQTRALSIQRAAAGAAAFIDLSVPPVITGAVVIATFHTHPHPSAEGWTSGPSSSDIRLAMTQSVPCLIRAEDGIHVTGPESRRGGLAGNPRFPQ